MTSQEDIQFTNEHEAIRYLCGCDPVMANLVARIGPIGIARRSNHFESLVKSIIGQQLSVKAAATIYGRFLELVDSTVTPDSVLAIPFEKLREAGLSNNKARFVRDLAEKVKEGELVLDFLEQLENEAVITELTKVKGIGKWTAEMFLIFSLGRLNVLSLGDAGLQRAAKVIYAIDEEDTRTPLEQVACTWSPYEAVASLYLWRAIDDGYVKELEKEK